MSVLPDYDIHNKHVSNQPNHTHYGVKSGDDNRDDNGVGVVVQVAGESAIRVASRLCEARGVVGVGEVLAEAAGVVVQRGELAPIVGTVVCALHGPRREGGAARVFSLDPGGLGACDAPLGACGRGCSADGRIKSHAAGECDRVRWSEWAGEHGVEMN